MKSLYPEWTIAQAYGQSNQYEAEDMDAKINRHDGNSHSSMFFKRSEGEKPLFFSSLICEE